MNILFVCTGNTCRSPMAQYLLRHKAPDVNVKSAGIFAMDFMPANENTVKVMRENWIKMKHATRQVKEELLEWADLVLTMTFDHKIDLFYDFPLYAEKYFTLIEYVETQGQIELKELKEAYEAFMEKRSSLIEENEKKLSKIQLHNVLRHNLANYTEKISRIEETIPNRDIDDPFGMDIEAYRETFKQIDKYITKLVEIIHK